MEIYDLILLIVGLVGVIGIAGGIYKFSNAVRSMSHFHAHLPSVGSYRCSVS